MYHCQGCTERREWIKKWIKVGADRVKDAFLSPQPSGNPAHIIVNEGDFTDGSIDTSMVTTDESNSTTELSDIPVKTTKKTRIKKDESEQEQTAND